MLSALRKLFGFKPSPERRPRKDLLADLESAAAQRGVPMPPLPPSMTRRDLEQAAAALREAPAAVVAEAAGTLHDAPPPLPQTAHDIARAARAEALQAGATEAQANQDALQALSDFRNQRTNEPATKPMQAPRFKAADQGRAPITTPTVKTNVLPMSVAESEAINWPPQAPEPKSAWGGVAWAKEFVAYTDSLPPPALHAAAAARPNFMAEASLAQQVLKWEDARLATIAKMRR